MVGKVIIRQGSRILEASLDEETNWHCRDSQLENLLNQTFRWGVGCGDEEGLRPLCQAAAALNGQIVDG
jgi:hypothetical protein